MTNHRTNSTFNPNYHIDIHDVINTQKPTRINIRMTDVQFETEDYEATKF